MAQSLSDYFGSYVRMIGYVALELVLAMVGAAIAWVIVPMLRGGDNELPPLADVLLRGYWVIVVAMVIHAAASGFVIPRLRGRGLTLWVLSGMLLPILLILVPFAAYMLMYNALFDGLR
jgi:hypothetical protein